jgi:hypothetical protein
MHAAPGRPIRLCYDKRNLLACLQQALERLRGELRGTGED